MRQHLLRKLRERKSKLNEVFHEYVRALINSYPQSTIILFGSRARRGHLPYSDYDIMIVIREPGNRLEKVVDMYRIKPPELSVDLVLVSEKELDDPIIRKMLEKGCRVIYDGLRIAYQLPQVCRQNETIEN